MSKSSAFSPHLLKHFFNQLTEVKRILVAFSGGMDSSVLLHALVSIRQQLQGRALHVVHIDHGLNDQSGQWSQACEQVCREYGVPYDTVRVDAVAGKGESPEATAREARYRAFAQMIGHDDCVATAHHRDDQAETLLLQLARGSGPAGLAGMPEISRFHAGLLVRPLLGFDRQQLADYAQAEGLQWIDDPSNFNRDLDRNFLRHNVLPVIRQRWPGFAVTVSRSARHIAQAQEILDQQALSDLQSMAVEPGDCLDVAALLSLQGPRRSNVIRAWIRQMDLPAPQAIHMAHIEQDVLQARQDAQPRVSWPGCEVRRYGNKLYALSPREQHDIGRSYRWQPQEVLDLPGLGSLHAIAATGRGLSVSVLSGADIRVGFRQGGEQCQPVGRAHKHDLKKLFQENRVPPWERERVPLIYINGTLACIVGLCYCQGFNAVGEEPGFELVFKQSVMHSQPYQEDSRPG